MEQIEQPHPNAHGKEGDLTTSSFQAYNQTPFCYRTSRTMTTTIDLLDKKQRTKIGTLARKGCSIHEVGTALGFTQGQIAQILEDENHPFNQTYWQAKVKYSQRLRDLAMKIAENSDDDAVRVKMLEFLAKENTDAFENKRQHTGYTNIRKLLTLVRSQFGNNPESQMKKVAQDRTAQIAKIKEVFDG